MKKRTGVFKALALRLWALLAALWLLIAGMLTWAVASDMDRQIRQQLPQVVRGLDQTVPTPADAVSRLFMPYIQLNLEPLLPVVLPQTPASYGSDDWFWGKWDLVYGFDAVTVFYDGEEQPWIMSGRKYLTFVYTQAQAWTQGDAGMPGQGYMDLSDIPGGETLLGASVDHHPYGEHFISYFAPVLRMQGHFEGAQFIPSYIALGEYTDMGDRETEVAKLNLLDSRGKVTWNALFGEERSDDAVTTIYAAPELLLDTLTQPVSANGQSFSDLTQLLIAHGSGQDDYEKESLWDAVAIYSNRVAVCGEARTVAVAAHYSPLGYGALRLIPFYAVSALVLLLLGWLLLRKIRNRLTRPLAAVEKGIREGRPVHLLESWQEVDTVQRYYKDTQKHLAENQAQLQQLHTALDYAKNAEESRKMLISNITHELKTPLAVIHSYAEGLQEGIAPEKREQYLAVILEQTRRMDDMVRQMLEMSRMEAGKVRLHMEQVDLADMSRQIVDTFRPLLEEKQITVDCDQIQPVSLMGDEARLHQVVTNLVSNACKYTVCGGTVRIRIFARQGSAYFKISNMAPHLPQEALEKVWDSFYRVDKARSDRGTGLGLSLVRQIVQLHRGSCQVANTMDDGKTAVEFTVKLPLR